MEILCPEISKGCVVAFILLLLAFSVKAQKEIGCRCLLADSLQVYQLNNPFKKIKDKLPSDSTFNEIKKLKQKKIVVPEVQPSKDQLFNGHLLTYNATYVSKTEGVYDYGNILQQHLRYTTKMTLFENLPFNVSLFGRYTNSDYFRNYLDINIDLSRSDLAAIAKSRQTAAFGDPSETKLQLLQLYFNDQLDQLRSFSSLLRLPENPSCLNQYIHCKEILANKDVYLEKISSGADSINQAATYVEKYDKARHLADSLNRMTDSLTNEYRKAIGNIHQIQHDGKSQIADRADLLRKYAVYLKLLNVDTIPTAEQSSGKFRDGFKKLSIGRSMPSSTQLSFQNISINGINTRYSFGKVYSVLQAGWTDFGLRDFVFNSSKQRINNFVYNAGLGIEYHNKDYILVSFFGGKQNPIYTGNSTGALRQSTLGVSVSGQWSWKQLTLNGEIAQTEYAKPAISGTKKTFSISDNTNKAYCINAYSLFPRLGLNISSYYKYYGANYYGFNAYRINANNSQWGVQGGKSFFRNALTLNAGIKTNDYQNPYVEQVYSGKNTITTLNASFRKNRWFITAGYIPSYQYVSINDTIYENRYQVINGMASYSYRIGDISSATSAIFNRFLNDNDSSVYFYGNSSNMAVTQTFYFNRYSSSFNTSIIKNNRYTYTVFDGSIQYRISEALTLKGGFKISSLSSLNYESKAGGYGSTSLTIPKVGNLSIQVDCNYYPDINYKLYNNTVGTLVFTTYFK